MSAGNQIVTFRLPPDLIEEMRLAIASRNDYSTEAPWTWSDFVRHAIVAELRHLERGRKGRKRKERSTSEHAAADGISGHDRQGGPHPH